MVVARPDNGPVHLRNGGYRTMSYAPNGLGAGIGGPEDQEILYTAMSEEHEVGGTTVAQGCYASLPSTDPEAWMPSGMSDRAIAARGWRRGLMR